MMGFGMLGVDGVMLRMRQGGQSTARRVGVALGIACGFSAPASADAVTDFYTGKTMTYIVGGGAAGSYDFYGRMVARYMEPALPNVTIVVKNVPAAGGIAGANAIYAARADGLTIG